MPTAGTAIAEQEILARIDADGLYICEAELGHTARWDEQKDGSLLDVLGERLLESGLHFRLTERGRTRLPVDYKPPAPDFQDFLDGHGRA